MLPLQITFRDVEQSDAIKDHVEKKVEKLQRFFDRVMSCRIAVDMRQKSQHQGKIFGVRIDMGVPGGELVVNRVENEDVYVALRDAFDAAKRQLDDYVSKLRSDVKVHPEPVHGKIARLFKDRGYGFIDGADGNEYFFNDTNTVHPDFEKLEVGIEVHFVPTVEAEGFKANRVSAGKHR